MNTTTAPGHRFTDRAASTARIRALAALPVDPWDAEPELSAERTSTVVRVLGGLGAEV